MNIGINGMGRIGRSFFRVLYKKGQLNQLKAVNDLMPTGHLIYLLQYDTVRGKFPSKINATEEGIEVDGHRIKVTHFSDPGQIPWKRTDVHVVVEATGVFANKAAMQLHVDAGTAYCILTTTGTPDVPLYILGVNDGQYQGEKIFSIGSCTVNGTAPLIQALQDFSPQSVYLNVIHAYSTRQNILDSYHPELRRSRASADNIIPLNINLDGSLQRLFPSLKDKIKSITSRVPVPCGVLTDVTVLLDNPPRDFAALKRHLIQQAEINPSIIEFTTDLIVSSDVIHNPHSLTIDSEFVQLMDKHAKLLVWFDNEWGFSNRIFDWINKIT